MGAVRHLHGLSEALLDSSTRATFAIGIAPGLDNRTSRICFAPKSFPSKASVRQRGAWKEDPALRLRAVVPGNPGSLRHSVLTQAMAILGWFVKAFCQV